MKGPRRTYLYCLLLGLCLSWSAPALAGSPEEAQRLFAEAEQAFSSEQFAEAARLFEQADTHSPHASVIYNAAVSWDQAGQLARAADRYLDALSRGSGLDERQALDAESRLSALRGQLGFVQITKPVGGMVSVAHKQRTPLPARFYLMPGDYSVLLETSSGGTSETPMTASAGETLRLELASPPEPSTLQPNAPLPPLPPAEQQHTSASTQRVLGWVGVALGVAAGGVAIYLGTQALAEQQRYQDAANSPRSRNDALEKAERLQLGTNVAWGGSALLGGTGLVLLLTSPSIEF